MSETNEPWVPPASKLGKEDDLDPLTMAAAKFPESEDSRERYPSRPHITFTASSNTEHVASAILPVNSHRAEQLQKERERRLKKPGVVDTNDLIDADLLRSWDARFAEKHGGSQ